MVYTTIYYCLTHIAGMLSFGSGPIPMNFLDSKSKSDMAFLSQTKCWD